MERERICKNNNYYHRMKIYLAYASLLFYLIVRNIK